ncbi:MAG: ion transporter [Gemmatimonadales bacterium]|nr:MAG: ion transporter [Gemmatimonadales bacterium]
MVLMFEPAPSRVQRALFKIIFEARTRAGRIFDLVLILTILASVVVVLLESVPGLSRRWGQGLPGLEWAFTLLFTVEYLVRLWVVRRPGTYARSFFGIVDLLAILPTYLSIFVPGAQVFLVIRLVRLLRVFHVFNLGGYLGAAETLRSALRATRFTLAVFLTALLALVVFLGALMYLVEGADSGFSSIPVGIYWAVVTVTTLGYGDLVPETPLGRGITSGIVLIGYWALAVPVAIVSVELSRAMNSPREEVGGEEAERRRSPGTDAPPCPACGAGDHQADSLHCRRCGGRLSSTPPTEEARDGGTPS